MHVASLAARSALLARRTTPLPPPPPILFSRGLAKKAAQKKGKEEEVKMHVDEKLEGIVRGLNIFKEQSEEVKVKPDSEYPDWVFTLHMPRADLEELTAHYERDPSTLTPSDAKRMVKQWNRRRIKEGNEVKAKR